MACTVLKKEVLRSFILVIFRSSLMQYQSCIKNYINNLSKIIFLTVCLIESVLYLVHICYFSNDHSKFGLKIHTKMKNNYLSQTCQHSTKLP